MTICMGSSAVICFDTYIDMLGSFNWKEKSIIMSIIIENYEVIVRQ